MSVALRLPIGVASPLGKRLVALSFIRLAVLGFFLLVIELYYLDELSGFSTSVAVATIVTAFVTTALFALTLRRESWHVPVAHAQLVTDQLTWTAIVYISGGVTSGSTSLYGLTSVSGAILLGPQGAIAASAAGGVFYLTLCHGFAMGWLLPPSDQAIGGYLVKPADMVYPAFSTVLATLVVALLAAYLAERLREYGGKLEDANRRASEAERLASLGRLASGLAHEIRNPLGSIRGSIELLRTGAGLAEEDRQLCRIIEHETARLNQLVTDMLDLSRPRPPERSPVDLATIASSVVELANGSGRGPDVAVRYEGPASLSVIADDAQLHQVLWNLVRNAIQASPSGATVAVSLGRTAAGGAEVAVRDHGPGVEPAAREHLFDAFFTTRSHGVGIGLAVVKQIVDAHAFTVSVTSAEGEGAIFTVEIPESSVIPANDSETLQAPSSTLATMMLLAAVVSGCAARDWVRPEVSPPSSATFESDWPEENARKAPAPPSVASDPEFLQTRPPSPEVREVASVASSAPEPLPPISVKLRSSGKAPSITSNAEGAAVYRNTYYFFPEEPGYPESGATRQLFDKKCHVIRKVSKEFHDKLCVQGSGRLATGETVSFAKRGCTCAATCPRSSQRICYEALNPEKFPWGRGANGRAITPLRSVAVDPSIPLGTVLYVPEMNGLRDLDGKAHDGCFVAEDRGSKVKGRQIDFFVGAAANGEAWNRAVPSNRGVHVVLGASQCAWLQSNTAKSPDVGKKR